MLLDITEWVTETIAIPSVYKANLEKVRQYLARSLEVQIEEKGFTVVGEPREYSAYCVECQKWPVPHFHIYTYVDAIPKETLNSSLPAGVE